MTDTKPTITLTLSIEQTNAILMALGQQPFVQVAELIAEVKRQAEACIAPPAAEASSPS